MLQRLLMISMLALLLLLVAQSCAPSIESYVSMQIEKIDGRPYLLLESFSSSAADDRYFSIYTPKGDDLDEWEPIIADKLGPAYSLFPHRQPGSPEMKLGVLHARRLSFMDLSVKPPALTFENLPFKWLPETATVLNDATYIFGIEQPKESDKEKKLRAARFANGEWKELEIDGPAIALQLPGFWMKAVTVGERIQILWRTADWEQTLAPEFEGPRFTTIGPLKMIGFNGETFEGNPVKIDGLPRGNAAVSVAGNELQLLVQTNGALEDALHAGGPLEFWTVSLDGKAQRQSLIENSRVKSGLLAFIAAERLEWGGQEYIVRSNWQMFEIWKKSGDSWAMVTRNPRGLLVFNLETVLLGSLSLALALITFGAALAYRRRKQRLAAMKRVLATELYATLGLRMGAYAIDLALILGATVLFDQAMGWEYRSPISMLPLDMTKLPHWSFFFIYMGYLVGSEAAFGRTVGKALMGLMVVGDNGEKINLWSALVRNLIGLYERLPQVALVAMWMMLLGPRRQRIGDLLSRSYVVQRAALELLKKQRLEDSRQQKVLTTLPAITPEQAEPARRDKDSGSK